MKPQTTLFSLLRPALVITMFAWPWHANSAIAADLHGIVLDADGAPAAGAAVQLTTSEMAVTTPIVLAEIQTDSVGEFRLAIPERWYDIPSMWRQALSLIVTTKDRGHGGMVIHSESPLPRQRLTIQLERWTERRISLRSADDKPLSGVKVRLTALLLPIIYPPRYSQTPARQMAQLLDGPLRSTGKTNDEGIVMLTLPATEFISSIDAEIEPDVFVSWVVYSSSTAIPENWSETLNVPKLRRLPIHVTNDGDNLDDLSLVVSTMPLGSSAERITTRQHVVLNKTGDATAVIQNEAIVMLRNTGQKPTTRHLSPRFTSNSTMLEQLDVAFRNGVAVTGRAIAKDGQPAANISMFVINNWDKLDASTDAEGTFSLTVPVGPLDVVPAARNGYRAEKVGPESAIIIPENRATHDIGDITLIRLKSLKGIVRNESGRPVSGVRVSAFWDEPDLRNPQSMINRDEFVTTDVAGHFSVPEIDPNATVTVFAEFDGAMTAGMETVAGQQLDEAHLLTITPTAAITVSGRVTDDSGAGVSDIPVTLRHRAKPPLTEAELPRGADITQVTLITDAHGDFTTPKLLPPWGEYIAVIHAASKREAISGWKAAKIGESLSLPPVEVSAGAEISGQILTVDGNPLSGARVVVLTSDGQAETQTDDDGSFHFERLAGRMPMLIAEADGYFANGTILEGSVSSLKVHLPQIGQLLQQENTTEAPAADPALWTIEQKRELALKLVENLKDADPQMEMQFDSAIARAVPEVILAKLDSIPPAEEQPGQMIRGSLAIGLATDQPQEAMKLLEQLPDGPIKLMTLMQFSTQSKLPEEEQLPLLARLVQEARGMREAEFRVIALGMAAERLLDLGQQESGEALLRETHEDAKKLAPAAFSGYARGAFAEELAQVDADAAMQLMEPITDTSEFNRHLQNIAHELAAIDPDKAISILARFKEPDPNRRPIGGVRDPAVLRVCYRMIRVEPEKAEELARTIELDSQRVYCFSLMAESLLKQKIVAEADRERARRLHDEAWLMLADIRKNADQTEVAWLYPSTVAAILCQQTVIVASEQLPHRIWQTIALRRPVEPKGTYRLAGFGCSCEMALMLANTDRQRASQVATWVPSSSSGAGQFQGYVQFARPAAEMIVELHPEQCEASLELVDDSSQNQRLRLSLVKALLRTGDASDRANRNDMLLWFPDDEDTGPID